VPQQISARVEQDGLWGFTGASSPPPSPSTLPACLPALADWDITVGDLVRSQRGTEEEEWMVKRAGHEVHEFIKRRWVESEWETAWFVNPPVRCFVFFDLPRYDAISLHRGFKVSQVWRISMYSRDTKLLKKLSIVTLNVRTYYIFQDSPLTELY
jgi:hypothetical protein